MIRRRRSMAISDPLFAFSLPSINPSPFLCFLRLIIDRKDAEVEFSCKKSSRREFRWLDRIVVINSALQRTGWVCQGLRTSGWMYHIKGWGVKSLGWAEGGDGHSGEGKYSQLLRRVAEFPVILNKTSCLFNAIRIRIVPKSLGCNSIQLLVQSGHNRRWGEFCPLRTLLGLLFSPSFPLFSLRSPPRPLSDLISRGKQQLPLSLKLTLEWLSQCLSRWISLKNFSSDDFQWHQAKKEEKSRRDEE